MAKEIAIRLANVSKYYKLYNSSKDRLKEVLHPLGKKYHHNYFALRNINLNIYQGEILGIVGSNGSGKSTLLKTITGVLYPNEGTVTVNGRIAALLELGTGFNPEFTGIENIYFYGVVNGCGEEFMQAKVDEIVAFADIGEYINQPVKSYSSGMKTRLAFAVAIHVTPDILILDEVLAVGDELFRRKCHAKMEEFLNRGTTVLYVSHDINSIVQMCTRAILLNEGAIVAVDAPRTVTNFYQRLLYASPEKRRNLLEALLSSGEISNFSEESNDENESGAKEIISDSAARSDSSFKIDVEKDGPAYVEELKPLSSFEYRNEDIEILDPHVSTRSGARVNILNHGETYVYSVKYVSRANRAFPDVSFGFDIKNLKGTILSSLEAVRSHENKIGVSQIRPGETIEIRIEFVCRVPAGTYFVNSGLSSFESGKQEILNRKIDSACFKVLDSPGRLFGGLFSCMRVLSIKTPENEQEFYLE